MKASAEGLGLAAMAAACVSLAGRLNRSDQEKKISAMQEESIQHEHALVTIARQKKEITQQNAVMSEFSAQQQANFAALKANHEQLEQMALKMAEWRADMLTENADLKCQFQERIVLHREAVKKNADLRGQNADLKEENADLKEENADLKGGIARHKEDIAQEPEEIVQGGLPLCRTDDFAQEPEEIAQEPEEIAQEPEEIAEEPDEIAQEPEEQLALGKKKRNDGIPPHGNKRTRAARRGGHDAAGSFWTNAEDIVTDPGACRGCAGKGLNCRDYCPTCELVGYPPGARIHIKEYICRCAH
jgi:hypothetical protein